MTIEEVYEFFHRNWAEVSRELGFSEHVNRYWRKLGYIPVATQLKIERKTNGSLKASFEDASS